MGHSLPLFLCFRLFNSVNIKQLFNKSFANDWIRTTDLWCWRRLLYQLSHNHCPSTVILAPFGSKWLFSALWPSSANFILTKEPGANNPNSLKLILVGLQRILAAADIVKFAMASVWPDWANFKSSLPKKSSKLAQIFGKFIGYFEVPNFWRKTYFGCFFGHQLETLGYF